LDRESGNNQSFYYEDMISSCNNLLDIVDLNVVVVVVISELIIVNSVVTVEGTEVDAAIAKKNKQNNISCD
jgi:hypothetical protein